MEVKLDEALAAPDAKRRYNQRLFATIAERYDLITRLLSFGRDQAWKARVIELADVGASDRVLDLACGTGDLTSRSAARGARAIGLDLTPRMLNLARQRLATSPFVAADMCLLPFGDAQFSVMTVGYGLRNVPDLAAALSEIYRVLKPGGRLCALDFDKPESAIVRAVYLGYLNVVGGALGWLLHRDPDTYRYIPASIKRYPGARGVVTLMASTGFVNVRRVRVFGGLMAIHVAAKPT